MFDVFTELATDEGLETNGTWFPLGSDARVLVARSNNRAYLKGFNAEYEANRIVFERGGQDDEAAILDAKVTAKVMSKTILLGWENIAFKGKPLTYSQENAEMLLNVKDFRAQIQRFSQDASAYRAKLEVEQGKA